MLTKLCKCGAKIPLGDKLCKGCTANYHRAYDKHVRNVDAKNIYNSSQWRMLTAICKQRFDGIDVFEYYMTGKIIVGELSHHIIEVTEDTTLAYDIENLIYISEKNHQLIHSIYNKSNKEKKKLQTVLCEIKNRYLEGEGR